MELVTVQHAILHKWLVPSFQSAYLVNDILQNISGLLILIIILLLGFYMCLSYRRADVHRLKSPVLHELSVIRHLEDHRSTDFILECLNVSLGYPILAHVTRCLIMSSYICWGLRRHMLSQVVILDLSALRLRIRFMSSYTTGSDFALLTSHACRQSCIIHYT